MYTLRSQDKYTQADKMRT